MKSTGDQGFGLILYYSVLLFTNACLCFSCSGCKFCTWVTLCWLKHLWVEFCWGFFPFSHFCFSIVVQMFPGTFSTLVSSFRLWVKSSVFGWLIDWVLWGFYAKTRFSSELDQFITLPQLPHQTGIDLFSKLRTMSCIQYNKLRLNISLLSMLRGYGGTFL